MVFLLEKRVSSETSDFDLFVELRFVELRKDIAGFIIWKNLENLEFLGDFFYL